MAWASSLVQERFIPSSDPPHEPHEENQSNHEANANPSAAVFPLGIGKRSSCVCRAPIRLLAKSVNVGFVSHERGNSMRNINLLVVVDESEASKRAVSYVGQMVGRRRGFKVFLARPLSGLPASLLEYGGARTPDEEKRFEAELEARKNSWVLAAQEKVRPDLNRARAVLRKAGLAAGAIDARFCYPADGRARGDEILDLAKEHKCRTLVVGSESLSWLRQLLGSDPVEGLLQRGKGFTIWVVE